MRKDTFIYRYGTHEIPYDVWYSAGTSRVDTIVFLGTVQVGELVKMTAQTCPPHVAVVEGAQHWYAADDGHDIPDFMIGYTSEALRSIAKKNNISQCRIIADSQAAACVIGALSRGEWSGIAIPTIVLVQPLGLNQPSFGATLASRVKIFKQRVLANAKHQIKPLITDKKLRYSHRQLLKHTSFRDQISEAHYAAGLAYDAVPSLKKIVKYHDIVIVCGGKDELFPMHEITANLEVAEIQATIEEVANVPHSPLTTKLGQKLLQRAFAIIDDRRP